ncbi:AraC-type DNA-binding protein [Rhizobiales bacterium GAS113]|nr:AraC-type DNA-binding protein [Rhizobiales bacterium GAS113]
MGVGILPLRLAKRGVSLLTRVQYGRQLPGVLRVGAVLALPDILHDLGAEPDLIMSAAGVAAETFADPENMIPFAALGRILALGVATTGCAHLGLLLGQRSEASSLGIVGLLAQHSKFVGIALETMVNHRRLYQAGMMANLNVAGGTAVLSYAINESVEGADQISDAVIATAFKVVRGLCGEPWSPTEVLLPRRRPADDTPFVTFFQAPLRFGAESAALAFPEHWLTHVPPRRNPIIHELLQKRITELQGREREGFALRLRPIVRTLVLTHRCSAEAAAQLFNMSPTTFDRRLAEEKLEFRKIAGEVRYEIARLMLAEPSVTLAEVAARLDYSCPSAFARAFQRWSGGSPSAWRNRNAKRSRAASVPAP